MTNERNPTPVFDADGHLAELAIASIADGQLHHLTADPAPAMDHLEACDRCTRLVGQAALFSMAASDALVARAEQAMEAAPLPVLVVAAQAPSSRRARRPLPVAAIVAALLVAAITAGPSMWGAGRDLHATIANLLGTAPFVARIALSVATAPWGQGRWVLVAQIASAAVLFGIGLRVASRAPRGGHAGQAQEAQQAGREGGV
jgi:hypothetical protein